MRVVSRPGNDLFGYGPSARDMRNDVRETPPRLCRGDAVKAETAVTAQAPAPILAKDHDWRWIRHCQEQVTHITVNSAGGLREELVTGNQVTKGVEALFGIGMPWTSLSFFWYVHFLLSRTHLHGGLIRSVLPANGPYRPRLSAKILREFNQLASYALGEMDPYDPRLALKVYSGDISDRNCNRKYIARVIEDVEAMDRPIGIYCRAQLLEIMERCGLVVLGKPGDDRIPVLTPEGSRLAAHRRVPVYRGMITCLTPDGEFLLFKGQLCLADYSPRVWDACVRDRSLKFDRFHKRRDAYYADFQDDLEAIEEAQSSGYRMSGKRIGLRDFRWVNPARLKTVPSEYTDFDARRLELAVQPDFLNPFYAGPEHEVGICGDLDFVDVDGRDREFTEGLEVTYSQLLEMRARRKRKKEAEIIAIGVAAAQRSFEVAKATRPIADEAPAESPAQPKGGLEGRHDFVFTGRVIGETNPFELSPNDNSIAEWGQVETDDESHFVWSELVLQNRALAPSAKVHPMDHLAVLLRGVDPIFPQDPASQAHVNLGLGFGFEGSFPPEARVMLFSGQEMQKCFEVAAGLCFEFAGELVTARVGPDEKGGCRGLAGLASWKIVGCEIEPRYVVKLFCLPIAGADNATGCGAVSLDAIRDVGEVFAALFESHLAATFAVSLRSEEQGPIAFAELGGLSKSPAPDIESNPAWPLAPTKTFGEILLGTRERIFTYGQSGDVTSLVVEALRASLGGPVPSPAVIAGLVENGLLNGERLALAALTIATAPGQLSKIRLVALLDCFDPGAGCFKVSAEGVTRAVWPAWVTGDSGFGLTGDAVRDVECLLQNEYPLSRERILAGTDNIDAFGLDFEVSLSGELTKSEPFRAAVSEAMNRAATSCFEIADLISSPVGLKADPKLPCRLAGLAALPNTCAVNDSGYRIRLAFFSLIAIKDKKTYVKANLDQILESRELFRALFLHRVASHLAELGYSIRSQDEALFVTSMVARAKEPERMRSLSFDEVMGRVCHQQLQGEFVVPVSRILSLALYQTLALATPDKSQFARWLENPPKGSHLKGVDMSGQRCWTSEERFKAECEFLSTLCAARMAPLGWLESEEKMWTALRDDRHSVAFLACGAPGPGIMTFGEADCEKLRRSFFILDVDKLCLGDWPPPATGAALLIKRPDCFPSVVLAYLIRKQLEEGGRVLLACEPERTGGSSVWLKSLQRDLGIPVLAPSPEPLLKLVPPDLRGAEHRIMLAQGRAPEVDYALASNGCDATLLCLPEKISTFTNELRRRRAGKRELGPLPETKGEDSWLIRQVVNFLPRRTQKKSGPSTVTRRLLEGDRIRLVGVAKETGEIGLPNGGQYEVARIERDGAARLTNRRILPLGFNQWDFNFCISIDEKNVQADTVVCEAGDLERVVSADWPIRCRRMVVCAHDLDQARGAVEKHLKVFLNTTGLPRIETIEPEGSPGRSIAIASPENRPTEERKIIPDELPTGLSAGTAETGDWSVV